MIISQIIGGLGNQMFQYAVGRALTLKYGGGYKLDISRFIGYNLHQGFEIQRIFNCPIDIANESDIKGVLGWQSSKFTRKVFGRQNMKLLRNKSFIVEPHFHYWQSINNMTSNAYLSGYWQSEKYFIDAVDQIRRDFNFKIPFNAENNLVANRIDLLNSVSLHIRRGDYLANPKNMAVYANCPLDYYCMAIKKIHEKISFPHFFIFSDDIIWAKKNLTINHPHTYVDINKGNESYNDMRLMSLCKHNIIANSTFSWWGAWLNSNPEKIVIAPKLWFSNKTNTCDLHPQDWMIL